jgi:ribosomal protein S3AE
MGPALCSKLLDLKGDKQVIVIKPSGRVEDVSGPKAKTNFESIPKRNSELQQLQQYKDVMIQ